jgi:2-phospho-L-lactate guanylyltransferase
LTHVLIATRGGATAKTRCAGALTGPQRAALVRAMLGDMLSAVAATDAIKRAWVSTPTAELAMLATDAGAHVIAEPEGLGLSAAFDHARRRVADAAPGALLVLLPGDLPLLDPAELGRVIATWRPGDVLIAPAKADGGTGALLMTADTPFPFAYGPASFARHLAAAGEAGLNPRVVEAPCLAYDLDRPTDFAAVNAHAAGAQTRALLASLKSDAVAA